MRRIVPSLVLVAALAAVVAGSYVSLYPAQGGAPYSGFDTAWYVWRAKAVAAYGIEVLPELFRPPFQVHPARVGHPLVAGFVSSGTGIGPALVAYALPGLVGAVVGLAAGAFAIQVLGEPRWSFLLYGIGVGGAVNVVLVSVGHADTLLTMALVMAAAVVALVATEGKGGLAAGMILLGAAAVTHLSFATLFVGLLVGLSMILLPESLNARKEGVPLPATPTARLALLVAGGAAAGGTALALSPGSPVLPGLVGQTFAERIARDAAVYRFPLIAPLAAAGAVALLLNRDPLRRRGLLFVLVWAASAAIAFLATLVLPLPAHRVLAFALGVPLLAMGGVSVAARALTRMIPGWLGGIAAGVLVTAALIGSLWFARDGWRSMPPQRLVAAGQAEVAGRYLETIPGDRPVVFVVDPGGPRPSVRARLYFDIIKAALHAEQIVRSYVYVGDPAQLLAGRPTVDPDRLPYTAISRQVWEGVRSIMDEEPVVLALDAFSRQYLGEGHDSLRVEPGVTVIRGPAPPVPVDASPPRGSPTGLGLLGTVGVLLLFLSVVGGGWSAVIIPGVSLTKIALSPAVGISMLVLGGVAAGAVRLDTPGARAWVLVAMTLVGWVAAGTRVLRRRGKEARTTADR